MPPERHMWYNLSDFGPHAIKKMEIKAKKSPCSTPWLFKT